MTMGDLFHTLDERGLGIEFGKTLQYIGKRIEKRYLARYKSRLIESRDVGPMYLNIGGAEFVRPNWRVLDFADLHGPRRRIFTDYNIDLELQNKWPIETSSFDLAYTAHTIHCLTDAAVEHTFSEANRILASGAGFRVVTTDIKLILNRYQNGNLDWFATLPSGRVHPPERYGVPSKYALEYHLLTYVATDIARGKHGHIDFERLRADFQSMDNEQFLNTHKGKVKTEWQREHPGAYRNWFTANRLRTLLSDAGFTNIGASRYRQSRFAEMCDSDFDTHPYQSLYMDCIA